jgi:hypothetical protein
LRQSCKASGNNVTALHNFIISATSVSKMNYIAVPVKPPLYHIVRLASPTREVCPHKGRLRSIPALLAIPRTPLTHNMDTTNRGSDSGMGTKNKGSMEAARAVYNNAVDNNGSSQ